MTRTRARSLAAALGLLLVGTACAAQGDATGPAPGDSAAAENQAEFPSGTEDTLGSTPTPTNDPAATPVDTAPNEPVARPTESRAETGPSPTPTPHPTPAPASGVQISGQLMPTCVKPGGTMSILIQTNPGSPVAYHAVYAGEEGGSGPPYGKGHGGNNDGITDADGHYSDSWTVSSSAPVGPARVDVVTAWQGEFGKLTLDFEVVHPVTGQCS